MIYVKLYIKVCEKESVIGEGVIAPRIHPLKFQVYLTASLREDTHKKSGMDH